MTGPAFILGNGPTLPGDLSVLRGQFTVGVNRILQSGFTPTVVLWVDRDVYSADMERSDALLVTHRPHNQRHRVVKLRAGDDAWRCDPTPTTICCCGNTGVAAARWALALGCFPVYLVGMSAEYADGKTDFYGQNLLHGVNTLDVMRRELLALIERHGDKVVGIQDQVGLDYVTAGLPARPQEVLRDRLRVLLPMPG